MTEAEKILIEELGIKVENKTIYTYQGHRYENAKDAINYAKTYQLRADSLK